MKFVLSCTAALVVVAAWMPLSVRAKQRQTVGPVTTIPRPAQRWQVAGVPTGTQMMRVLEGAPFTVPSGKILVVTGLGLRQVPDASSSVELRVDGEVYYSRELGTTGGVMQFVSGIPVREGKTVEASGGDASSMDAEVWGYMSEFSPSREISIRGIPRPRDLVLVREGEPFLVPADSSFVALGLSSVSGPGLAEIVIAVDGQVMNARGLPNPWSDLGGFALPVGLSFPGPATVTVAVDGGGEGMLFGYVDRP